MRWADVETVADAIGGWTDAQIACRTNGHAWKDATVSHRPGFYTIHQRCTRNCGCWRECDMTDEGYLVGGWQASYPKNGKYLLPSGSGRVGQNGQALMRLERVRKARVIEVDDA